MTIEHSSQAQIKHMRGSQIDWTIHRRRWGRRPPSIISRQTTADLRTDRRPIAEPTADRPPTDRRWDTEHEWPPIAQSTPRQADPTMDPTTGAGDIFVTKSALVDLRTPHIFHIPNMTLHLGCRGLEGLSACCRLARALPWQDSALQHRGLEGMSACCRLARALAAPDHHV